MPDRQRVPVSVVDKSLAGSLEAIVDDGDLMLTAPVIDELELSYSINVDAALIFDIDESFVVSEVECLVQAYLWETTTELPLAIPDHAMDASLAIPPSAIEIGAFELAEPIEVMIDASRTQVLVQVEPIGDDARWARLSEGCYVLVNDTYLAGFLVVLRSADEPLDEALAAALEGPRRVTRTAPAAANGRVLTHLYERLLAGGRRDNPLPTQAVPTTM
ncbi:MAG: hypothetical protein KY458_07590 [Actinobacteria bacterium]|nr:hypothetical protein [Actinomycetota bacterium]